MFLFDDTEILPIGKAAKLNPYRPRPLKPHVLLDEIPRNRVLTIDTESYFNYFLFAFKCVETGHVGYLERSPESTFDPKLLSQIMHENETIGFNSLNYDLPLIWLAYKYQDTALIKQASDDIILNDMYIKDLQTKYDFPIYQTRHIDLIEVCPLTGSLKTYAGRLHAERMQDLPFEPNSILTKDEATIIRNYCFNDNDNTKLIYSNLSEQLQLRRELSVQYRIDLMSKSDAQIAEAVISNEIYKLTGKRPRKVKIKEGTTYKYSPPSYIKFKSIILQDVLKSIVNSEFIVNEKGSITKPQGFKDLKFKIGNTKYAIGIGGLHSMEKNRSVTEDETHFLRDLDAASFYPYLINTQGLYPQSLGKEFLPVYQSILDRRLKGKKEKNYTVSESLKIVLNGGFGKLGSKYSILYSPDLLIQVTLTGQLSLLMLAEALEEASISVVSANTDGIVIRCPRDREPFLRSIVSDWEAVTGFQTEATPYRAIYSRDVNAYLAIKEDKSTKGKNAYFDPWSGGAKSAIFRFHKNPVTTICIEAATKLITDGVDIADTIRTCKDIRKFVTVRNVTGGAHKNNDYLGKVIRFYYATGITGEINYVKNGNKVPDTDGAKPCMDLPTEFPDDIDYEWYEKKTIDILTEIRYFQLANETTLFD